MQENTVSVLLAARLRRLLQTSGVQFAALQELRLRAGRPFLLTYKGKEYTLTEDGRLSQRLNEGCVVSPGEVQETLECVSGYSLYAFADEMKQGFLTVPGGHRVGLAGRIVTDGAQIACIRHISFINIRLSHQVKGCADAVMGYLVENGKLLNTLILSPPGCGKTTLLRDVIRQISDGTETLAGQTVGVVDERSELAGSYLGIPQNDVGSRTDVLDCCPKRQGMMMLLRAMSPQVIAVDEIGGSEDLRALQQVQSCGCRLLATMHGDSFADVKQRLTESGASVRALFQRFVMLGSPAGSVRVVTDAEGAALYRGTCENTEAEAPCMSACEDTNAEAPCLGTCEDTNAEAPCLSTREDTNAEAPYFRACEQRETEAALPFCDV